MKKLDALIKKFFRKRTKRRNKEHPLNYRKKMGPKDR